MCVCVYTDLLFRRDGQTLQSCSHESQTLLERRHQVSLRMTSNSQHMTHNTTQTHTQMCVSPSNKDETQEQLLT